MSTTQGPVRLRDGTFDVNFSGDSSFVLDIVVENVDSVSDYPISVPWSISAGTRTLASDTINSRLGPGATRSFEVEVNHDLEPGQEVFACVSVELDTDNITGL
jgi:hypothetical protein